MTGRNPLPFQVLVSLCPLVCVIAGPGMPWSAQHLDRSIPRMQQRGTPFPVTTALHVPCALGTCRGAHRAGAWLSPKAEQHNHVVGLPVWKAPGNLGGGAAPSWLLGAPASVVCGARSRLCPCQQRGWPRASSHGPCCPAVHRHCSQASLS